MIRAYRSALLAVAICLSGSPLSAETRPINADQSTLTVFVYKSGLFSAFADNHTVKAPVATGSISDEAPLSVELTVHSSALRVLDPDLSADKRADVQARMLSADVLDTARFPEITTTGGALGDVVLDGEIVALRDGKLDFAALTTSPTRRSAAGDNRPTEQAVKVKDELKVQFDIVK